MEKADQIFSKSRRLNFGQLKTKFETVKLLMIPKLNAETPTQSAYYRKYKSKIMENIRLVDSKIGKVRSKMKITVL